MSNVPAERKSETLFKLLEARDAAFWTLEEVAEKYGFSEAKKERGKDHIYKYFNAAAGARSPSYDLPKAFVDTFFAELDFSVEPSVRDEFRRITADPEKWTRFMEYIRSKAE